MNTDSQTNLREPLAEPERYLKGVCGIHVVQ